ncbi:MAG: chloride channel protein [Desulfobacteraceae bacterium]|nr:chloride channel protein [Desulfobacteraceae bacterium]
MKGLNIVRFPSRWIFFRFDDRLLLISIGALVGSCSGLAALALNRGLIAMFEMLGHYRHLWWAFIMPGIGAALSSLFLEKIIKEGAGHGVPEVLYSVSRYGGLMRFRSSFSRLISSCLTIGSGGSAGPEAPVVMSGAAIGSNIAQLFSLNDRQRVALVGCGTAGAVAAIFNAPIAGLVFTIEVIIGEWSALNIVPIAVASVFGAQVSRLLQGNQIAFTHLQFNIDPGDTIACLGLAVVTALVSILLTRALRLSYRGARHIHLPIWVKAAIGGCLVGGIGFFLPDVLGEGYHSIQAMVEGTFSNGLLFVALLVLAKILATSFTLGWGGSGGIFAPCLVIGSFTGLMYHRFIEMLWPGIAWVNEGCFALLGMAGLISGILQAPLTGMFLIVEITGGYEVILPLILVSAISTTLCHSFEPASFYMKDLVEKGHFLRPRTDARVLADLSVSELVEKDCIIVTKEMKLGDFVKIMQKSHRNFFPVEDENSREFLGLIHLDDIREYLFDPLFYETVFLEQIMDTQVRTVGLDDDLSAILDRMDAGNLFSMPVVANNQFVGMISKATLLDKYRNELIVQTNH